MSSYGPAGYTVIGAGGARYGPVDVATLRAWVGEGRVVAGTPIEDPISGMTHAAATMPELSDFFQAGGASPGYGPPMNAAPPYGQTAASPYANRPYQPAVSPYPHLGAYGVPPKQKVAALLLAVFLGGLGIHRFYLGHSGSGSAMLVLWLLGFCTFGVTWIIVGIWALVDIILIATGSLRDHTGQMLV